MLPLTFSDASAWTRIDMKVVQTLNDMHPDSRLTAKASFVQNANVEGWSIFLLFGKKLHSQTMIIEWNAIEINN